MDELTVRPATPERWDDLVALFGPNGAYSGCWCMYLRESSAEFAANCPGGGGANRDRLEAIVRRGGHPPGLLAYDGHDRPVGWVSVSPREDYPRVLRSPVHKPVDDVTGVWSVACFFVHRSARGRGVADALLTAAVRHAGDAGAAVVEAYPNDDGGARRPSAEVWRGTLGLFERAGFEVVARRKPARPVVRRQP